jgi:hypothetical protein
MPQIKVLEGIIHSDSEWIETISERLQLRRIGRNRRAR